MLDNYNGYKRRPFTPFDPKLGAPRDEEEDTQSDPYADIGKIAAAYKGNPEVAGPPSNMIKGDDPYGSRFSAADERMRQYENYVRSEPRREDYKSSKGRGALAAAIGVLTGNVNNGIAFRDEKYNEAQRDYQERGKGLLELAKLENTHNAAGSRDQHYLDMYRDDQEDNDRDEKYKGLANDVARDRYEEYARHNQAMEGTGEANRILRERNVNSAIAARNAQLGISRERLGLAKNKNTPKPLNPSQQMDVQLKAERLVDQNLATTPEFSEIYNDKGKIDPSKATNNFHALRRYYIEQLMKKYGQGKGSMMSHEEPDNEPDYDEDDNDTSGFDFQ